MSRATSDAPTSNGLATYCNGVDQRPYTIIGVSSSGHMVTLQARDYRRGLTWENPQGRVVVATRRRDGVYRERGHSHGRFYFGSADLYTCREF